MKKLWEKLRVFLKTHGIENLAGVSIPPGVFVLISGLLGIFLGCFAHFIGKGSIWMKLLFFFIGTMIPAGMLMISNKTDNDKMLVDLRNLFEMLKIQIHAGVYIMDALENCIRNIQSKRLKNALNRLIHEIYMSRNVTEALDDFNENFSNPHIDTLVIILKQAMETGYSVSNLDSAFEQILDVEKAIYIRMENSMERNVQILQVILMAGIIAMTVYCSFVEFKEIFEIF